MWSTGFILFSVAMYGYQPIMREKYRYLPCVVILVLIACNNILLLSQLMSTVLQYNVNCKLDTL